MSGWTPGERGIVALVDAGLVGSVLTQPFQLAWFPRLGHPQFDHDKEK